MNIRDLVKLLQVQPESAPVLIFAEGSEAQKIRFISLANGTILIGDTSEGSLPDEKVIYDNPREQD